MTLNETQLEAQAQAPELLPCPLMGHVSTGQEFGPGPYVGETVSSMPKFYTVICPGCCSTASSENRERIIAKWNTRADAPRATGDADAERERIIAMADALEYELPNLEQMKGVETLRKKLQAEPPRATAETGDVWQPIETAPRDSSWILGVTLAGRQIVVRWGGGAWEDDNRLYRDPIQWMSLPFWAKRKEG
jgi:hypothetical protein